MVNGRRVCICIASTFGCPTEEEAQHQAKRSRSQKCKFCVDYGARLKEDQIAKSDFLASARCAPALTGGCFHFALRFLA
jgi:hypothetical protein